MNYKNLLVSGCSFTQQSGWADHVKNKYKLKLTNLACSGGGNTHIANSIIAHCEINRFTVSSKDTYVLVMWSGADRLDTMIDVEHMPSDLEPCNLYKYWQHSSWLNTGGRMGMGIVPDVTDAVLRPAYNYKSCLLYTSPSPRDRG